MAVRLPPLNALKAFETAARNLSVKRAAIELNVTSAAVSHQIRAMEEYLGVLWAYLHYFCAGIRHLAMDKHVGLELATARATSYAVLIVTIVFTAAIAVKLW